MYIIGLTPTPTLNMRGTGFHIHSFPPGEIRPLPVRKMTGKNTGKALTLRRHSDRHVRLCFPRLQREIQRSVPLLATE